MNEDPRVQDAQLASSNGPPTQHNAHTASTASTINCEGVYNENSNADRRNRQKELQQLQQINLHNQFGNDEKNRSLKQRVHLKIVREHCRKWKRASRHYKRGASLHRESMSRMQHGRCCMWKKDARYRWKPDAAITLLITTSLVIATCDVTLDVIDMGSVTSQTVGRPDAYFIALTERDVPLIVFTGVAGYGRRTSGVGTAVMIDRNVTVDVTRAPSQWPADQCDDAENGFRHGTCC
ncbi:hypothetical protein CBL_03104 [Carabus blaptoides fortunei]